MEPKIISGGVAFDDRGSLRFVNDFNFEGVQRFYQVENHRQGFIRAWHGHKKEGKYVYVAHGSIILGAVPLKIDDTLDITLGKKCILSSQLPKVVFIPPNYANGFKNLENDTIVMFFSTSSLEESKNDDIRYPYDTWNIWNEDFR